MTHFGRWLGIGSLRRLHRLTPMSRGRWVAIVVLDQAQPRGGRPYAGSRRRGCSGGPQPTRPPRGCGGWGPPQGRKAPPRGSRRRRRQRAGPSGPLNGHHEVEAPEAAGQQHRGDPESTGEGDRVQPSGLRGKRPDRPQSSTPRVSPPSRSGALPRRSAGHPSHSHR